MRKRKHSRVNIILPVEVDMYDETKKSMETIKGELVDLCECGAKVVIHTTVRKSKKKPAHLKIDLPPCYSNNPDKADSIKINSKIKWMSKVLNNTRIQFGLRFDSINTMRKKNLVHILRSEKERYERQKNALVIRQPKLSIHREIHSCNMYSMDFTVGCEHACLYCHFSKGNEKKFMRKYPHFDEFPVVVDITSLYTMKKIPKSVIYLSPSSDPFASMAKNLTHEVLSFLLPKGVKFNISTKAIIPDKTMKLLEQYSKQIETIAIGITNFDRKRNMIIESQCPSAIQRLNNVKKLCDIGCAVFVRMDPIFPLIDDDEVVLRKTIKRIASVGVKTITGTYLFSYGQMLREMNRNPFLKKSIACLKEKSYPMGGKALSVSLETKKKTYSLLNSICKEYNMTFNTCGCKETRLKNQGYSLVCRNI